MLDRLFGKSSKLTTGLPLTLPVSTLIHVGLFIIFYFLVTKKQPTVSIFETTPIDIIEVSSKSQQQGGAPQAKKRSSRIGLRDLGFGHHVIRESIPSKNLPRAEGAVSIENRLAAFREYGLFQFIYNQIDSRLTYPTEFKKQKISGVVHARLSFSNNGTYLKDQSQIESDSLYLRVHVRRILRKVLEKPIPEEFLKTSKPFLLNCTFAFEVTEHDNPDLIAKRKFISENNFFFFRHHYRSVMEWELGPLRGLLPLPVVGIDVGWIIDKTQKLIERKPEIDPMDKYRKDPEF